MKRTLLESYALVVCLLTAIVIAVAFTFLSWNLIKISAPSFTISSHHFKCHQNDQEYKKCLLNNSFYDHEKYPQPIPSETDLPSIRKKSYETLLVVERRDAQQALAWICIILLINLAGFLAHWIIANRARN